MSMQGRNCTLLLAVAAVFALTDSFGSISGEGTTAEADSDSALIGVNSVYHFA